MCPEAVGPMTKTDKASSQGSGLSDAHIPLFHWQFLSVRSCSVFCMHYAKLPIRNHPINDSLQRSVSYMVITFLILKYHRNGFTFFD